MGYQEWSIFFASLGLLTSGMTLCLVIHQYRILGRLWRDVSETKYQLRTLLERLAKPALEVPSPPEEPRRAPKPPVAPLRRRESDLVGGLPGEGGTRPRRPAGMNPMPSDLRRPSVPTTSQATPPPVPSQPSEVFSAELVETPASDRKTPVAPQPTEREEASSAAAALRRFWNWIIVGEEHVPENVSYEYAVVTAWLVRLGVLVLLFGIGFFLKYSIDQGWISPTYRALMAAGAGVAFILTGGLIHRKQYRILAHGLTAAGIAALYATVFASLRFYHLIELDVAFTLLIGITILGGVLALVYNANFIAALAATGGYLTPVLAGSEGDPAFLYVYLAALTLGVFFLAFRAGWAPLAIISFVGVYGWLAAATPSAVEDMPSAMLFWAVFFVLFSGATTVRSLAAGEKSTVFNAIFMVLIAAVTFGLFSIHMGRFYGPRQIAWPALGMTAFYGIQLFLLSGYDRFLSWNKQGKGRDVLTAVLQALTALFAATGAALVVRPEWIGLVWAGEMLVLGWLTVKNRSATLAALTAAAGAAVLVRTLGFEWHRAFGPYLGGEITGAEFLSQFHGRFGYLLLPPLGAAFAAGWAAKRFGMDRTESSNSSALERLIDGGLQVVCAGSVLAAVGYAVFETHLDLGILLPAAQWAMTTALLFAVAGGLLLRGIATRDDIGAALFGGAMTIGALKFFVVDTLMVYMKGDLAETPAAAVQNAGWHSIGMLVGGLVAIKAWYELRLASESSRKSLAVGARCCLALVPSLPTVFLGLEAYYYCRTFEPGAAAGAVSSVLMAGAFAAIALGIAFRERVVRWGGLTLVGVVVVKIFLIDLDALDPLYRIIAFLTVGGLLLAAALLYLRFRSVFLPQEEEDASPPPPLSAGDHDDAPSA
ncbi:hypothetical protein JCM19992_05860 [Thermostilla marina]